MKEYEVTKKYKFMSQDEIIGELNKTEYQGHFCMLKTNIIQSLPDVRPDKEFENMLKDKGIRNFAYIKFFRDHEEKYGIVAGKTGSSLVNGRSDVYFSTNINHGLARQFLKDKNFEWYKEEILIIKPKIIEDIKENRKEALAIERDIKKRFKLLGS